MIARFIQDKDFKTCYGEPKNGYFSLDVDEGGKVHWDHCREQFAVKFTENLTGFYFSHPSGKTKDIAEFITRFELVTGIQELKTPFNFSNFAMTNKDRIMWVEPSPFWLDCFMKRSLFTILLRCGFNYDSANDNFDDALFDVHFEENQYLRNSKLATLRFMFGFTKFTGVTPVLQSYSSLIKHGWVEEFSRLDESAIRKRLILPAGETPEPIIGMQSLWT